MLPRITIFQRDATNCSLWINPHKYSKSTTISKLQMSVKYRVVQLYFIKLFVFENTYKFDT